LSGYEYDDPQSQLEAAYEQDPLGTMAWIAQNAASGAVQAVRSDQQHQDSLVEQAQAIRNSEKASQILAERHGAKWAGGGSRLTADYCAAYPDALPDHALGDPRKLADTLETAWARASAEVELNQGRASKQQDDETFARISAAHKKSWSALRAMHEDGGSVHDILSH
jgi:hypothetical protein